MRRVIAPYAVEPARSRGRLHPERESEHRSPFQRDRDRIIHSTAFRRLKHKTQVFVEHEGDHYRTRLTHSIEVAQIARTIARALGLDEDLAEALSLAHDLGHTPFGHAGETQLHSLMAPYGGFDHNGQALRVVTELERRYASFDGLNLTWETLEGLIKHNGPLAAPLPHGIGEYNARHDLELSTHASAEAQVAAIADDIAYNNHDLDDGLRAGLFTLEETAEMSAVSRALTEVDGGFPDLDPTRRQHETLRRVFGFMVDDVIAESQRRLDELQPASAAEIRAAPAPVVAFSPALLADITPLRTFLFQRMYRHTRVNRMMSKAKRIMAEMFGLFMEEPNLMPAPRRAEVEAASPERRARIIADYIAGMTDRYALDEHRKLFDPRASA
ncbi:MAG: deoxyguanosinetriphosphate triphosphohydrolase [Rhodobacteraceae bacterium]|nr:deoxyguanosinetriphosphate triphosphohydrolase [Paracoccaceae bacterium]